MFSFYRCFLLLTIATTIITCSFPGSQTTPGKQKVSHNLEPIIQLGHSGEVTNALFVPNSGCIVSASLDGSIKIWESVSGREIKTLKDPRIRKKVSSQKGREHEPNIPDKLNALAVSPDGKYLVSGGIFGHITIWEVSTGNKIKTLKSIWKNEPINSIAFSGDGDRMVTGTEDGSLQIWDFHNRRIVKNLKGHSSRVNSVAMGPNGRFIFSGSSDGSLILWDAFTDSRKTLQKVPSEISAVALSSDGKFVLSADAVHGLKLWNTKTGKEIRSFQGHYGKVNSISFSPDNRHFVSGGENSSILIWALMTGSILKSFPTKNATINSIRYSFNGNYILSGYADGTLAIWRIKNSLLETSFHGSLNTPFPISFSNDSQFLLSGISNNALDLWDVKNGELIKTFRKRSTINSSKDHGRITSVGFSSDNLFVTALSSNGDRKSWNIFSGKEEDISQNKFSLKFSTADLLSDGRILSSSWGTKKVNIINARFNEGYTLGEHTTGVTAVRFSSDGEIAVSGENAGLIKIWKVSGMNKRLGELKGHLDAVTSISLIKDGSIIGSSSKDNSIRIWDKKEKKEIVKLISSKNGEWIIATPDGYYNSSPEGSSLIHWSSIDRKETYSFEQFESLFRRPDIIKARLSGDLNAGRPAPKLTTPPRVEIPGNVRFKETFKKSEALTVTTFSERIVKSLRVFNNGRPLREIKINAKEKQISIDIPLIKGANRITTVAYDDRGFSSNPKHLDVISKDSSLPQPNLHVLGVGISSYPNLPAGWQLDFAHTDVKALIGVFQSQKGEMFREVHSKIIVNTNATVDSIADALAHLSEISKNDIAIIALAGHGIKDKDGKFYFLTSKGSINGLEESGLNWSMFRDHLSRIKGRVILFLDACHSGSIVKDTIVPNDEFAQEFFSGKRGGVMVFSASKGRQYSMESPDIGGGFGIFTYAVTQGLTARSRDADVNNNGYVEFMEIVDYVRRYVDKETYGAQTPWLSRKELFGDFAIAAVN